MEVLKHSYISTDEIQRLAPIGKREAVKIRDSILLDMREEGMHRFATRPILVPTERVLEKLGLSAEQIVNGWQMVKEDL